MGDHVIAIAMYLKIAATPSNPLIKCRIEPNRLSLFTPFMSSLFLDLKGDPIPLDKVLGYGASAVVVLRDGLAVKTPLRYRWSSDVDVSVNTEVIKREQDVYRRL